MRSVRHFRVFQAIAQKRVCGSPQPRIPCGFLFRLPGVVLYECVCPCLDSR